MSRLVDRVRQIRQAGNRGFTLVEMLLAMSIFGILGAMLLTTVVVARDSTDSTRLTSDLNEEARVAMNRMSRELRQATELRDVKGASGAAVASAAPTAVRSFTFAADFDGDGTVEPTSPDPEELTYSWDGTQLLLTAADVSGTPITQPVLAGHVTGFSVELRSSLWQYDCNANASTDWTELDNNACAPASAAVGDNSGTLTAAELAHVDSLVIKLTVLQGSKRQDYRVQVDVRNAA